MDREEAIALLLRNVEEWNESRKESDEPIPSLAVARLSEASLGGANLREANLRGTDFRGADLRRADLRRADLSVSKLDGAMLSEANLSKANLRKAKLGGAKLRGTDLRGTDLREANLREANISDADLSGANLSEANLSNADLGGANLSEANLSNADLSRARLSRANLTGVNLREANLRGATLHHADLSGADLTEASLRPANLIGVNIREARFNGADLSGAQVGEMIIGNVDLSSVVGLDTVRHHAPSTIGVDTLFASNGRIPDEFLRGCGVPEQLIEYLPALVDSMEPIQHYSCFISYSGNDEAFAKRLHSRLETEKLRVWFAPEDMRGGKTSDEQIDVAIRVHDRLLLVLSRSSMASNWVEREITKARKKERETGANVLFPISLVPFKAIKEWECLDSDTGEDLAKRIRKYHIPNFKAWKDHDSFEAAFSKLLEDLRAEGESKPAANE